MGPGSATPTRLGSPLRKGTSTPIRRNDKSTPIRSPIKSSSKLRPSDDSIDVSNIKVIVRVRPLLSADEKPSPLISVVDSQTIQLNSASTQEAAVRPREADSKLYDFDASFGPDTVGDLGQQKIFDRIGSEFLEHNLDGYHTCIFAYGQTGSGKSYTMMGTETEPGLIPRTCRHLFEKLEQRLDSGVVFNVRVSYFEVYNEQVYDLLSSTRNVKLRVRESPSEGPYVENLNEFVVSSAQEALGYLEKGSKARSTAATKVNSESSRSHAVFTMKVKQILQNDTTETTYEKVSRVRLIDLAGSERATASGATGARFKEGNNINKSLTTLGRVIAALASTTQNPSAATMVPYRDSILTRLLKDSLGGNSKTAMVACLNSSNYDETASTLRYAQQAKNIRTRAVVNHEHVSAAQRDQEVLEMKEQITQLQASLLQESEQRQQSELFKEDLGKLKAAIRFYEDRAEAEQVKRKSIQQQAQALRRHNSLLKEHLVGVSDKAFCTFVESTSPAQTFESFQEQYDQLVRDSALLKSRLSEFRTQVGV